VTDVRVPAVATVVAAVVAIAGSIFTVWLSGRQRRDLQVAQWDKERLRAARAAEIDACARLDAAVVIALGRLTQLVDLANRPRVRRRVLGRDWPRQIERILQDVAANIALPHSTTRLTVATAPAYLPPRPLHNRASSNWRERIHHAAAALRDARRELARTLEGLPDG
jgi:hypothetical protein